MGGRKPQDLFVEGDLFVLEQRDEVSRYPSLVQPPRYVIEREQPLDLGREREQAAGTVVVVQRLHAEVVACAEQALCTAIPEREREVAEQVLGARLAPALVSGEDQLGISGVRGSREQGAELGAIVDTGVGHEHQVAPRPDQRLLFPE